MSTDDLLAIVEAKRQEQAKRTAAEKESLKRLAEKHRFEKLWDGVKSAFCFNVPESDLESHAEHTAGLLRDLGDVIILRGWDRFLPRAVASAQRVGDSDLRNGTNELFFLGLLQKTIDVTTTTEVAEIVSKAAGWANGGYFLSESIDDLHHVLLDIAYPRPTPKSLGKTPPVNQPPEKSGGKGPSLKPCPGRDRDVELEKLVTEAEDKGVTRKWAYARNKYNELHPREPLGGGRAGHDIARAATRRVRRERQDSTDS
jgi:hypothetical protein